MKESRLKKLPGGAKPITVAGITYHSFRSACMAYNQVPQTVRKRLRAGVPVDIAFTRISRKGRSKRPEEDSAEAHIAWLENEAEEFY